MITRICLILAVLCFTIVPCAKSQEADGTDLQREVNERDLRVSRLPIEEQLKLRAAQQKALEDPLVKAAMEKRNRAIDEYRAAIRASMIKSDPSMEAILNKVAIPPRK